MMAAMLVPSDCRSGLDLSLRRKRGFAGWSDSILDLLLGGHLMSFSWGKR
jgi:hypothetical protein